MLFFDEYFETDPKKKTLEWGNRMITHLRSYWKPLIQDNVAKANMDIILSRYNMANVMKMFKDPKKLGMEFLSIAIMEKVRNILVGESVKAGVNANVNCLDPVAEEERKKDKNLLANRKDIEEVLTHLQQSIGLPEYKMQNEKAASGKPAYAGNLEMFDDLGLNSDDPGDRGYFMRAWHRLKHEMDAQEVVNAFLKYNEVSENVENWVNDVLAKKVIAKQAYVNEMSGAYEVKYLAPEIVYVIPGKRGDGKDAITMGFMESATVGDVIKRIGNSFDMAECWRDLVNAVNFNNKTEFTGLWDGKNILHGEGKNCIFINDFMAFKIQLGYIEFKSYDATVFKKGIDYNGNLRLYNRDLNYTPQDTGYEKETWYNEYTYKSFFFATSSNTQRLFKFGKLYHQVITGSEDEYSSFSIGFRKVPGPTVAEVAMPWIEIAQEAFTKFRWMVRKAKPKGRSYNYESLVQIAKHMIRTGSTKEQVHQVIQMFEEGVNEIFTIPKVDGQRVGGGIIPNVDLPNGLDPTAISFQGIIDWAVEKIKSDLGINDIREAYSPKQNDVYKLQMATLESSRNATQYIGSMIDGIVRDIAKHNLLTVQDIIQYKESKAYKFLQDIVGQGPIDSLLDLENVAMHRYGVFVDNFSTYIERQKILQDTEQAWLQGEITYDTKLLINAVDDFRKAAYILAFEKQRGDKLKQQEATLLHQRQMEADTNRHAIKMEELNAEGSWKWKTADRTGWWMFQANRDDNSTKMQANEQKNQQRNEEIVHKTDENIRQTAAKSAIETTAAVA